MEISSTSGLQGMRMDGMRPPPPPKDAGEASEEMSSKFIDELDANGDGVLSSSELALDSDEFANIDTDGDSLVSQEELKVSMQTQMEAMQTQMEAMQAKMDAGGANGMTPPEASGLMELMHEMASENGGSRAKASKAYESMQESMTSVSQNNSAYNVDQMLIEQLNIAV